MHFRKLALAALALVGGVGLSVVGAQAQTTVFNTFGPGDSFNSAIGYTEGGLSSFVGTFSEGFAFTPSMSGTLDSITLAIGHVNGTIGGTNNAHLFLTDTFPTGANPPNLETWTLTGLPEFGTTFTPELLVSSLNPVLTAGTTYYLYEKETGNEWNGWNFGQGTDTVIFSTNNVNYATATETPGAFRVSIQSGTPTNVTPEGSSFALLGTGLLPLAFGLKRRFRRA